MPHYLKNQSGCAEMNDKYPNSKFVWRDGKCDKVEGYINTKEHFNHNDIYHIIQMAGMYYIYKGVLQIKDFGLN